MYKPVPINYCRKVFCVTACPCVSTPVPLTYVFLGWFGICLDWFKICLGFAEDLFKKLFEDFSGLVRSLFKFGLKCV